MNIYLRFVSLLALGALLIASCLAGKPNPPMVGLGPPHVHFVDQMKNPKGVTNFLFRGGNPDITKDSSMDFESLVSQIELAAKVAQVALPSDFYLVDINLLNLDPLVEGRSEPLGYDLLHFIGEINYFQANPSKGELIFWESIGTNDNATLMLEKGKSIYMYLIQTLPSWQGDNLVGRMEQLNAFLLKDCTPSYLKPELVVHTRGKPAIIYGHCDCGCDRTGQLFGSYAMRWQNKTWDEVNQMNKVIATRPMECENYRNMQWYCLYLKHVQKYPNLDCERPHSCVKQEVPHPAYFDKGRN